MLERVIAERRWTVDGELPSSTEDKHGVRPIRIILPSSQHLQRPAVFLARAAGQVGTRVADEEERVCVSRRCVTATPWRALCSL